MRVRAAPNAPAWRGEVIAVTHAGYENAIFRVRAEGVAVGRGQEFSAEQLEAAPSRAALDAQRAARGVCTFWLAGACRHGDKCRFLHEHAGAPPPPPPPPPPPTNAARAQADAFLASLAPG